MKKIYKFIIAVFFLSWIPACTEFLDLEPQGDLTQNDFPIIANDALLATNAIYNTLRVPEFNSGLFPILDIMSDDTRKGSNPADGAANINPYDNFTFLATESSLSGWWNALYLGVKRANVVIEFVPDIEMNADLKSRSIGEAKFFRAFFYFDLVRAWGDVPLITSTIPDLKANLSPASAIYDLIIKDLEDAIASLPERSQYSGNDIGRVSAGAAKALLTRVYLHLNDFENARDYALEVIISDQYDLESNFEDANGINGEYGIESIFEAGAIGKEGLSNGGNQYANIQGVRGSPNKGWGYNRPTIDLQNSFETGDPRKDASIIYLGEVIDGVTILGDAQTPDETYDLEGHLIEIECYNQKVWTPGQTTDPQFGHNRRFIRYADVLLMAAEALNETGASSIALPYLNLVRERARRGNGNVLPDITQTDQALLREIIYSERRHELAMEGIRYWDILRTGRASEILGSLGFVIGKNELLPIPQSELDLTGNRWPQNPNWN